MTSVVGCPDCLGPFVVANACVMPMYCAELLGRVTFDLTFDCGRTAAHGTVAGILSLKS